jgi:hypothetical protein
MQIYQLKAWYLNGVANFGTAEVGCSGNVLPRDMFEMSESLCTADASWEEKSL